MTDVQRNDPWLTVTQAAEYCGLTADSMRDRMKLIPGAGRSNGKTGDWRVKASMIDAFMRGATKTEES